MVTSIGEFALVKGGKRLPKGHTFSPSETPYVYLQVTNMKDGSITDENIKYIDFKTHKEIQKYTISDTDLYITIAGTIGQVGSIPSKYDGMNLTENAAKIVFSTIDKEWLISCLSSTLIQNQFSEKTNKMAQPKLALRRICESAIPLPPLEEQKRIVAKVDELMALCDRLEAQQTDAGEAHKQLVDVLLDALIQSKDQSEFLDSWHRIKENFDLLFTTEYSVDALKQTILQLAVMGKLVPQDPSDEPAIEVLKSIKAERVKFNLPEVSCETTESNKNFKSPKQWSWTKLGFLIELISGQHLKPSEYTTAAASGLIPYLTGPAEFGENHPNPTRFTAERRSISIEGDILLTVKGAGVGKTNLNNQKEIFISRQLMAVRPILCNKEFVALAGC